MNYTVKGIGVNMFMTLEASNLLKLVHSVSLYEGCSKIMQTGAIGSKMLDKQ